MKTWKQHFGITASMDRDDIDTDQILPKQFMKIIEKEGFGKYLFFNWRYMDEFGESLNLEFPLNQYSAEKPTVLMTGKNFGCGSSREHAAWALSDYGIKVIIGESFGDIFSINAGKNGIALITLEKPVKKKLEQWTKENPKEMLKVDLVKKQIQYRDEVIGFEMEESTRERLLEGTDEIDETWKSRMEIERFAHQYRMKYPFLMLGVQ